MTREAVRTLLGDPSTQSARRTGSQWHYQGVGTRRACDVVVFGITVQDNSTERRELVLSFDDRGLDSATLTERLPEATVRTRLVQPVARGPVN